jgi:hypothetical protein
MQGEEAGDRQVSEGRHPWVLPRLGDAPGCEGRFRVRGVVARGIFVA